MLIQSFDLQLLAKAEKETVKVSGDYERQVESVKHQMQLKIDQASACIRALQVCLSMMQDPFTDISLLRQEVASAQKCCILCGF
jgi:hypothetical protein